jgi:hypothetical protein
MPIKLRVPPLLRVSAQWAYINGNVDDSLVRCNTHGAGSPVSGTALFIGGKLCSNSNSALAVL